MSLHIRPRSSQRPSNRTHKRPTFPKRGDSLPVRMSAGPNLETRVVEGTVSEVSRADCMVVAVFMMPADWVAKQYCRAVVTNRYYFT